MDDITVILRWSDGALGVTGWGWLFFFSLAVLISASVTNVIRKD